MTNCNPFISCQVDMKLEIQRVNQKINKIEELMTNFLDQVSKNNLQVIPAPATTLSSSNQVRGGWIISQLLFKKKLVFPPKVFWSTHIFGLAFKAKKNEKIVSNATQQKRNYFTIYQFFHSLCNSLLQPRPELGDSRGNR